ncbi:conserved hypothetical protein [Candidatus Sulfopaludibacter sp. SbA3]|nr:conserved hypothetical protein [Candidatus Sulfopaludibacter sp. SbA3]
MEARWTPMRWPDAWKDPTLLDLLKGTAIDCLLIGPGEELGPVRIRAQHDGYELAAPPAVTVIKGEWPGVKLGRGGGGAGPTGVPWVNSNGWAVRLAMALNPEAAVWVDASPVAGTFVTADSYLIAIADSAAHGGRWIVSLDAPLAASLAAGKAEAQKPWKRILETTAFFAARKMWSVYAPVANLGVISDFTGPNEFFGQELLNLLARAGAHARPVPLANLSAGSLQGLRAILYPDAAPPSASVRRQMETFVKGGGVLMTSEKRQADDPYVWANDAVVMLSHRYDLVRFWNGGATGSFVSTSPERKQTVVHLLFYSMRGPDSATVRVAGRFRSARAATVEHPEVTNLEVQSQKEAMEVHLPLVSQYVALQLES